MKEAVINAFFVKPLMSGLILTGVEKCENSLKGLYEKINCDCVTVVTVEAEGQCFDIWCDDEGLLKSAPKISLFIGKPEEGKFSALVGNLVITRCDEDGNMTSITKSDLPILNRFINKSIKNLIEAVHKNLL